MYPAAACCGQVGPGASGADVVLWHIYGVTHVPRLEDWPVMPVERVGFTLKPVGFFDRSPAADAPAAERIRNQKLHTGAKSGTGSGPSDDISSKL